MSTKGAIFMRKKRSRKFSRKSHSKKRSTSKRRFPVKRRRVFRRKSTRKSFRGKRRGYTTMRWPTINRITDHALRKHETFFDCPTVWTYGQGGGGGSTGTTAVQPKDFFYVDINNIYSPGTQNLAGAVSIPTASGFSQMNTLYRYWHVVGAKIRAKITIQSSGASGGVGEGPQFEIGVAAMSDINNSTTPNIDWQQWQRQRYFKRRNVVFGKNTAGVLSGVVSMYVRPDEIDAMTVPTSDFVGSIHYGTGTTPPTGKPTWWVMIYAQVPSGGVTVVYVMSFHVTYYVKWVSPVMVPTLSLTDLEPSMPTGLSLEEVKEGKEEKKESEDDEEKLEAEMFRLSEKAEKWKVVETPTPTATPKSTSSVPWTCLNPSHPKSGHEKVSSCV